MTTYTGGWEESTDLLGNGLICDVGEYSGPWPPPAPYLENLPLDAGEVDYIVCLPNPDGIADHVIDGSYPTVWRWTETWWSGAPGGDITTDDFGLRTSGGAAAVDALPAGAHLFVLWYDTAYDHVPGIAQPSKAALDLVPPGWVAGAGGSESGHWSAWQEPLALDQPAKYQDYTGSASDTHNFYSIISQAGSGFPDPYSTLAAAIAAVAGFTASAAAPTGNLFAGSETRGGAGGGISLPSSAISYSIVDADCNVNEFGVETHGAATVLLAQWIATIIDPGYADGPPAVPTPLDALTFGVDYDTIPGTDDVVQYESPGVTRSEWLPWDLWTNPTTPSRMTTDGYNGAFIVGPTSTEYFADWTPYTSFRKADPATISFASIYASEVGGPGTSGQFPSADAWPAAGIGTELDRITAHTTTTVFPTVPDPLPAVSLDGVGDDESFTLVMQPSIMLGVTPPSHSPSTIVADRKRIWEAASGFEQFTGIFDADPPQVRYLTGRWRYWIPGPKWRTVGGPWARPDGVPLRILTPLLSGNKWIDVAPA